MNMDHIKIVARKELREIATNKGTLVTAVVFSSFFLFTNIAPLMSAAEQGDAVPLGWPIIYLSLFVGTFSGFVLCGTVFFREKQSGVIETLLCTPLSLRSIWLGKVLGVAIPSYLLSLMSAGALVALSVVMSPQVTVPVLLVALHLAVVAPLFITSAIGLVGYVQLAKGMRENRLISMGVFVVLIMGLSISSGAVQADASLVTQVVLVLLGVAAVLFSISFRMSRTLDKEKIVTTIPD
ncbi:MAG: hypothetical protein ISF22_07810 [Methanomassiliicoccus sp.]|nr:hypothetical protein [Methanomassiliicoccus sp.]